MMQKTETAYKPLEFSLLEVFDKHRKVLFNDCHPKVDQARKEAVEFLRTTGLPTRKDEKWKNSPFPKQYDEEYLIVVPPSSYDKHVNEIFRCEVHGFEAETYSLLNGWYYSREEKQIETLENENLNLKVEMESIKNDVIELKEVLNLIYKSSKKK